MQGTVHVFKHLTSVAGFWWNRGSMFEVTQTTCKSVYKAYTRFDFYKNPINYCNKTGCSVARGSLTYSFLPHTVLSGGGGHYPPLPLRSSVVPTGKFILNISANMKEYHYAKATE